MKTEHEKLKEICDLIGFKYNTNTKPRYIMDSRGGFIYSNKENLFYRNNYTLGTADVREIIFTQEFMDLYYKAMVTYGYVIIGDGLMKNLDAPVEYLYKTLCLGKQTMKN